MYCLRCWLLLSLLFDEPIRELLPAATGDTLGWQLDYLKFFLSAATGQASTVRLAMLFSK